MPAVLLTTDIFNLGVFREPARHAFVRAVGQEGDADGLFLVLQPMILTGKTPLGQLPEAVWRHPHLADYFSDPAPSLGAAGFPVIIASQEQLRGGKWPKPDEWRDAGVPVPFPPGTAFDIELELTLLGQAAPVVWRYQGSIPGVATVAQPLQGDPALALPRADWPQVAVQSFIRPTITAFAELNPTQKAEVIDWLLGAIGELRQALDTDPPKKLTAHQAKIRAELIVGDPVFAPDAILPDGEARVALWRKRLQEVGGPADEFYTAFQAEDPEAPPGTQGSGLLSFDPPAFQYGPEQLPPPERLFPDVGGRPVTEGSYHHLLWEGIKARVSRVADDTDAQVRQALARLYGMGERIRWLKARRDKSPERFMEVDSNSGRLADGFGTNAHSLSGQVFRIGDVTRPITGVEVRRFLINGLEPIWKADIRAAPDGDEAVQRQERAKLGAGIVDFVAAVGTHAARTFSVTLKADGDNPKGLVLYQPKLADLQPEPLGAGLEMPRSLLDAATPGGRIEMPENADRLVVESPQRIGLLKKELLGVDHLVGPSGRIMGSLKVRVRLVQRRRFGAGRPAGGGSPAAYVYDVALSEALADPERALIEDIVANGLGGRELRLLIPKQTGAASNVELKGVVKREPAGGAYLLPLLRIVDGADIDAVDLALKELPASLRSAEGFAIHLVIGNLRGGDPFNISPPGGLPAGRTLVGLKEHFTSRVGSSADRLLSRLEAVYDPKLDATDPVVGHFASFNKLRVALQSGPAWSLITYPDALAPLPTPRSPTGEGGPSPDPVNDPLGAGKDFSPRGPHYFYGLAHHFDRELDDGAGGKGETARSSEEFRYGFVTQGGANRPLGGYVEHQYSARLALAGAFEGTFRLGHEVRNVAELSCEAKDGKTRRTVYLLGFSCDLAADHLSFSFDVEYIRQLFVDAWSDGKAAERDVLDAYRTLYEAFAELKIALAAGRLHVVVEGWAFDNAFFQATPAQAPTFFDTMRPAVRGKLDAARPANLAADLTAAIDVVLGADFAAFKANIKAVRDGRRALPVIRPVVLNDVAWGWVDRWGGASSSTELGRRAHVVRAGIRITRDKTTVVDEASANGRYVPMELSQELKDRAAWDPHGDSGFGPLAAAAQAEFKLQFQAPTDKVSLETTPPDTTPKSPLFRRMAWLACRDRLATVRNADFERELQVHFGVVTPYLSVPQGRLPDVPTVSDLYYATFGFLPLRRHRDLPDALVTQEYAFWLCRLMQAILDGEAFSGVQIHEEVLASDAEVARARVEKLLKGAQGVADQVVALIQRVDDREEIDKARSDQLYARVDQMIVDLDRGPGSTFRQDLRERFLTRPADFADLRGFGLAIFDRDSWSEQLYALRINKRIREDLAAPPGRGAPRNDADEFQYGAILSDPETQLRFLVDALDEASYDAEFTIEQNRYVEGGALVDDHRDTTLIGEPRRLDGGNFVALRGDAQARTAEDVLEAELQQGDLTRRYFKDGDFAAWSKDPAPTPALRRQLEVNVVHFNPSWRVKDAKTGFVKAWQYLLPSRRPPGRPTLLTPKADGTGGLNPRQSEIWIKPGEDPMQAGLFSQRAAAELKARDKVFVDLAKEGGGPDRLVLEAWPGYRKITDFAPHSKGWQRYDTVLAHHYFLVEADPDADVGDPIQNDAIMIETDAGESDDPPPPLPSRGEGLQESILYSWFWWDRMRRVPGEVAPAPKVKPTLAQVVSQLQQAFDFDPITERRGPYSLLRPLDPENTPERNGALFSARLNAGKLELRPAPTGDAVGYVVAAEVMRVLSDPEQDGAVVRYAVRVTTLEAPLRRTRVRLRVMRNYRDVDADLDNDVAAAFLMTSPMAEWSERPDATLTRVPADFIDRGVTEGWILKTAVSRKDWLSIDLTKPRGDPSTKRDFGPILRDVIETRMAANPLCRLWGAETEDKGWKIHGEVRDANRDAHEVYASPDLDRAGRVKRQNLVAKSGAGPIDDWSEVGDLTAMMDRHQIVSARFEISFVWSDEAGKPRMTVTLPVRFEP